MQNVLPRSDARAYTVSDDASADQRYTGVIGQCMYDYRKLSDRRWLKAPYLVMIYPYESLNGLSISV